MTYRILYLLFFLPLVTFSQSSFEGDWIECSINNTGSRKIYLLNKPYKDNNREIEDWFSELYPNSENQSIKVWLKTEEYNKEILVKYIIDLVEFNLISNKCCVKESIVYDKNGKSFENTRINEYKELWGNIVPNSHLSLVYENVQNLIKKIQSVNIVKETFSTNDRTKISSIINFPLNRSYPFPKIKNKEELKFHFDEVFDKNLIDAIANSKQEDWDYIRNNEIMFKDGDIWINLNARVIYVPYETEKETKIFNDLVLKQKKLIHPSINEFERPENLFIIDSTKFKIDLVSSSDERIYRLSIWNKNALMNKEPYLVINDGVYVPTDYTIQFTYNNYHYDYFDGGPLNMTKTISLYLDSNEIFMRDVVSLMYNEIENELSLIEEDIKYTNALNESNNLLNESIQFISHNELKKALNSLMKASEVCESNSRIQPMIESVRKQISFVDSMRNYSSELYHNLKNEFNRISNDTLISKSLKEEKKSYYNNYNTYLNIYKSKYDSILVAFKLKNFSFDETFQKWDLSDEIILNNILKTSDYISRISDFQHIIEKSICLEEKKVLKLLNQSLSPDNLLEEVNKFSEVLKMDCSKK